VFWHIKWRYFTEYKLLFKSSLTSTSTYENKYFQWLES
jgi:hypothetical protein